MVTFKDLSTVLFLALILSACATMPNTARENQWSYFEEWDANRDVIISLSEFQAGYKEQRYFGTWAKKKKSIGTDVLTAKLEDANPELRMAIAGGNENDTVASARNEAGAVAPVGQHSAGIQQFVNKADTNSDRAITQEEWGNAMFALGDENGDGSLTPIEFYLWQLLRG